MLFYNTKYIKMGACIQNQKKRYNLDLPKNQPSSIAKSARLADKQPKEKNNLIYPRLQNQQIKQDARNGQKSTNQTHETHSIQESLLKQVDRRKKPLRRQNYPLNSIGCLYFKNQNKGSSYLTEKQYFATGILISQRLVLTCAHFLDQYRLVGNQNLKFLMATKNNQQFGEALQKSIKVGQYFISKNYRSHVQNLQQDYGIAVLKDPIVRQRHISIGIGFALPQTEVSIYGYPYEDLKGSFDMKGMKGPLKQIRQNIVLYDIDTESGQSGSPILLEYAQNLYLVIGMHLGKHNQDDFNSGILITNSLIDELQNWQRSLQYKLAQGQTGSTACDTGSFGEKSNLWVVNFRQVQLAWEKLFGNYNHHQDSFENLLKKLEDYQTSKYLPNAFQLFQSRKFHQSLSILQSNTFYKQKKQNKMKIQEISISLYIQGLIYEKLKQPQIAQAFYTTCKRALESTNGNAQFIEHCYTKIASIMSQTGRRHEAKLLLQYKRAETESMLFEHEKKLQSAHTLIKKKEYQEAISLLEKMKENQLQNSSIPNYCKAQLYYRLSQAYLGMKKYSEWVEHISACLWVIQVLRIESIAQSSKWYNGFMKLAFDLRNSLDFQVKCKIGRAFKLLNNNLGFDMGYYCS